MRVILREMPVKALVLCALALVASGCAKQPGQIAATPVATDPYLQLSCPELIADRAAKQAAQQNLEEAQHRAAERDKGAMTVIHMPIAAITGQDRKTMLPAARVNSMRSRPLCSPKAARERSGTSGRAAPRRPSNPAAAGFRTNDNQASGDNK